MDRISHVAPVQEVCQTLWRPTSPLQHPTRRLQLWPHALHKVAPCMLRLLGFDTLGLRLRRQRGNLPSKILPRAWRALEMDSPTKTNFQG